MKISKRLYDLAVSDPKKFCMVFVSYLKYVFRHKWYVFQECVKLGIPMRGIVHDLSKFLPDEFIPYALHFYGNIKTGRNKTGYYKPVNTGDSDFDMAWLLHQNRNRHHWQYWTTPNDAGMNEELIVQEIPLNDRKEMVADWRGAGKAQGTPDSKAWYEENGHKLRLAPNTRSWIEREIGFVRKEMREEIEYCNLSPKDIEKALEQGRIEKDLFESALPSAKNSDIFFR